MMSSSSQVEAVKECCADFGARTSITIMWTIQYIVGYMVIFDPSKGLENWAREHGLDDADDNITVQWIKVLVIAIFFLELSSDASIIMRITGYKYITQDKSDISRFSVLVCNIVSVSFGWIYLFSYFWRKIPLHEEFLGLCMVPSDLDVEQFDNLTFDNNNSNSFNSYNNSTNGGPEIRYVPTRFDSDIVHKIQMLEENQELFRLQDRIMLERQIEEAEKDDKRWKRVEEVIKSPRNIGTTIIRTRSSSSKEPKYTGKKSSSKNLHAVPTLNNPLSSPNFGRFNGGNSSLPQSRTPYNVQLGTPNFSGADPQGRNYLMNSTPGVYRRTSSSGRGGAVLGGAKLA